MLKKRQDYIKFKIIGMCIFCKKIVNIKQKIVRNEEHKIEKNQYINN